MKIGIMSYRQAPYISANTSIAYIIGNQLSKKHEIVYIGRKQDECQESICEYDGIRIVYFNKRPREGASRLKNYLNRIGLIKAAFWADSHDLYSIVNDERIEALVCMIAPIEDLYITMAAKLKIPIYLYQLDPFYNLHDIENKRLKRQFVHYIKKVSHVFTTELLMNQYYHDCKLKRYIWKMSIVQFPKLKNHVASRGVGSEKIVLLYAGSLYGDRRADYLIDLSKCLPNDSYIVFCGNCETKEELMSLKRNGIVCKGYCSREELAKEMDSASFYINIGNRVKNQLPSKVIDYIGTGKPIINLFQIEQCSSKKMLEKYEYHLDIDVKEIETEKERIQEFVLRMRDKKIPWRDVENRYREYTPEFVAGQILEQIEGDLNGGRTR